MSRSLVFFNGTRDFLKGTKDGIGRGRKPIVNAGIVSLVKNLIEEDRSLSSKHRSKCTVHFEESIKYDKSTCSSDAEITERREKGETSSRSFALSTKEKTGHSYSELHLIRGRVDI